MNGYVCNREFEKNASGLLTELYEIDQAKSHKLLTQKLKTWKERSVLELADDAQLMDFMKHDCCQTKINKMWHGKLTTDTELWQVRLKVSKHYSYTPSLAQTFISLFILIPIYVMMNADFRGRNVQRCQ